MLVRIYGVHVNDYEDILETLPDEMVHAILKAPICKRMADPDACNPKCSMGYDFWLRVNIAKNAATVRLCFWSARKTIHLFRH